MIVKKCSICKQERDISKFGKDKYSKDLLTYSCLDCRSKASKLKRKARKNNLIKKNISRPFKKCPSCNAEKETIDFSKDKYTKDGLTGNCKSCRRAATKAHAKRSSQKNLEMTNSDLRRLTKIRICPSCNIEKSGGSYPIDRSRTTGLGVYCFDCMKKRCNNYDNKNREFRKKQNNKRTSKLRLNPEYRFKQYIRGAKSRGLEFSITIKDFNKFWKKPCFYCGDPIDSIGLDRLDNNLGYRLGNIESCCFTCNQMKSNKDLNEWMKKMKQIIKNIEEK